MEVACVACWVMLLVGSVSYARGEQFPRIECENLLGQTVKLPEAASGQPTAIVIGFSRDSQKQTKAWVASVQEEVPIYTVAVLEDAPRLVRGMAVRGMKNGVPEEQRGHYLVVYQNAKELKQAAGFDHPDDAYVLLLDKNGAIHWRFHGAVTDAALQELESQAEVIREPRR